MCAACASVPERHTVTGTLPFAALHPNSGASFDCDAIAGHVSHSSFGVSSASGFVAGAVYFHAIEVPDKWIPTISIFLEGPKPNEDVAGARLGRFPKFPDSIAFHLVFRTPMGTLSNESYEDRRVKLGSDIQFELKWTGRQAAMRFLPDGAWANIPMSFDASRLSLGCSSSEAIFHDVVIKTPEPP